MESSHGQRAGEARVPDVSQDGSKRFRPIATIATIATPKKRLPVIVFLLLDRNRWQGFRMVLFELPGPSTFYPNGTYAVCDFPPASMFALKLLGGCTLASAGGRGLVRCVISWCLCLGAVPKTPMAMSVLLPGLSRGDKKDKIKL